MDREKKKERADEGAGGEVSGFIPEGLRRASRVLLRAWV